MMIHKILVAVLAGTIIAVAGCATTVPPVSILYSPSADVKGGEGDLFLRTASVKTAMEDERGIRWVIGKLKDSDGRITGEILSKRSADDMVLDALKRELTVAGYRVNSGVSLPLGVSKGIDLTSIQLALEETAAIPKVEATGTIRVLMDVWKEGRKIKRLSYESSVSDVAIIDRERLSRELIERGLHGVMSQAVPEIIATLERKTSYQVRP